MSKCHKIFSAVFVVIALAMGVAVNMISQDRLGMLIPVSRFFEVMIPILGVGALLKYLLCCHHKKACDEHECK